MSIHAQMADGTVLEFPDGTADEIVHRAAKNYVQQQQPKKTVNDRAAPPKQRTWGDDGRDLYKSTLAAVEGVARGATAGLSDVASAAIEAPALYAHDAIAGHPQTLGTEYGRVRNQQRRDAAEEPIASGGGELGGGIASPINKLAVVAKGAPVVNALSRAAAGMIYGAVSGATQAQGGVADHARAAGLGGAVAGAAGLAGEVAGGGVRLLGKLGPRLREDIAPVVQFFTNRAAKGHEIDAAAMRRVAQRIQSDASGNGPTAQDLLDLRASGKLPEGKPLTLMDVGGENTRGYAGKLARRPGESRNVLTKFLNERGKGTAARLEGDVAHHIHEGSAYESQQALMKSRAAAARPLYEAAYQYGGAPIFFEQVKPVLARPSMQAAMNKAVKIAKEEGRDPTTLGLVVGKDGLFKRITKPTWQTWDYVKRGLDDVLESKRNEVTGKLVLDTEGRAIAQTRTAFRNALRKANPEYGKALDSYAGPSQSMDAIRFGQKFQSMRVEEISDRLRDMTPGEREFVKMGVADALQQKLARDQKLGGANMKDFLVSKVRPLFKSDKEFEDFASSVDAEYTMMATRNHVIGGSQTAGREAEDESNEELARNALHAARGNLLKPLIAAASAVHGHLRSDRSRAIDAAAARILSSPANSNALKLMVRPPAPQMQPGNSLLQLVTPGLATAGAMYAQQ